MGCKRIVCAKASSVKQEGVCPAIQGSEREREGERESVCVRCVCPSRVFLSWEKLQIVLGAGLELEGILPPPQLLPHNSSAHVFSENMFTTHTGTGDWTPKIGPKRRRR